jgi:hypothetical protein
MSPGKIAELLACGDANLDRSNELTLIVGRAAYSAGKELGVKPTCRQPANMHTSPIAQRKPSWNRDVILRFGNDFTVANPKHMSARLKSRQMGPVDGGLSRQLTGGARI